MARTFLRLSLMLAILCALAAPAFAQSGTVMPAPKFVGLDNNGVIINAGRLCTYAAGTTTPQATYSDVGLTTQNTNPVVLDPAGRATVFLSSTSYKFVLRAAGGALTGNTAIDCAATTQLWSQDNVSAIPTSSAGVDILGTAGEAITAGQCAYLSDGSGGKTPAQWYKCDSTNTYSSTLPPDIGLAPSAIASGAIGTIRMSGSVGGLTVTAGTDYFVGAAGAIASAAPANRRLLGRSDSVTSLVVQGPTLGIIAPVTLGGTGLTAGTSGGIPAFTSTTAMTSSGLLTQYGVVVGGGAGAVPQVTAAGTTGQVLVATTSANPAFANAAASGASMVLLKANSGTDTSAGATTVDSIATGAMTAKDKLFVLVGATSVTQQTASLLLYSVTDAQTLKSFLAGALAAAETTVERVDLMPAQTAATTYWVFSSGSSTAAGANGSTTVTTGLTAWTTGFTLGLRHGGVTGGGTLQWEWAVYKFVGQ